MKFLVLAIALISTASAGLTGISSLNSGMIGARVLRSNLGLGLGGGVIGAPVISSGLIGSGLLGSGLGIESGLGIGLAPRIAPAISPWTGIHGINTLGLNAGIISPHALNSGIAINSGLVGSGLGLGLAPRIAQAISPWAGIHGINTLRLNAGIISPHALNSGISINSGLVGSGLGLGLAPRIAPAISPWASIHGINTLGLNAGIISPLGIDVWRKKKAA